MVARVVEAKIVDAGARDGPPAPRRRAPVDRDRLCILEKLFHRKL